MGTIDDIWDRCKVCTIVKECQESLARVNHRSEGRPIKNRCYSSCRPKRHGIESNSTENGIKSGRGKIVDVNNKKGEHLGEVCINDCVVGKEKQTFVGVGIQPCFH